MASLSRKTAVFIVWGGFATLFVGALWHQANVVSGFVALGITAVMGIWFFQEWHRDPKTSHRWDGLYFSLGAGITLWLSHGTPLDPIASASLMGFIAALGFKKAETPLYAGAFLGMSSAFFMTPLTLTVTVFGGGMFYALSAPFFQGLGGKLGFLAWMTAVSAALFLRHPLMGEAPVVSWIGLWILNSGVIVMMAVLVQRASMSSVLASSMMGLALAGAVAVFPSLAVYGTAAFGASFVGMSSTQRLPFNAAILLASSVYTVIFVLLLPYFPGLGGKLGAMAFVSTALTFTTLQKTINTT